MTREEIRKRMDELARQDSAYSRADYMMDLRNTALRNPLFGQSVEKVHDVNRLTPLTEGTEPALVDGFNRARTIELGQRPVNDQPERPVVATNDEPVGLIREKDIRQKKTRRILRRYGESDKDPAVRGEGFG